MCDNILLKDVTKMGNGLENVIANVPAPSLKHGFSVAYSPAFQKSTVSHKQHNKRKPMNTIYEV